MSRPTPRQLAARKRWVKLLHEKKYRKQMGRLATRTGKSRCCLGVACDPYVHGLKLEEKTDYTQHQVTGALKFDEAVDVLPQRVATAMGMNVNPDVYYPPWGREVALSRLNDDEGLALTLPQIGDLIEAHYVKPYLEKG